MKKTRYDINCAVLTRDRSHARHVVSLCARLFKVFAGNKVVIRSRPTDPEFSDLSVALVGASRSRRLNRMYRHKDYATDVLSFPATAPHEGLGELVLCLPVLKRQAREHGHAFKKELNLMLIHGFLHLLGYDHEKSRKEELKMMKLQDKLLRELTR